ncbi:MAG: hypothetical protein IKU86_05490 [Thermoguttaceae bacterium]|nr:hypothetical protein [Thermoguttaceae bacterium]
MQSSARSSQTFKHTVAELAELAQLADLLPEDAKARFLSLVDRLARLIEETLQRRENDAETLRFIRVALETLRSQINYHLFDLEATRRENDALRRENELLRKRLDSLS